MTCFKAFNGHKPDNSKAMPFGCLAFLHHSKKLRKGGKFDPTANRCVILGYVFHDGHKGYLLASLTTRRFYISTNVVFAEGVFPYRPSTDTTITREFWGEVLQGRGAEPAPFGPSIEDWDADGNINSADVEKWLQEEDDEFTDAIITNNITQN